MRTRHLDAILRPRLRLLNGRRRVIHRLDVVIPTGAEQNQQRGKYGEPAEIVRKRW